MAKKRWGSHRLHSERGGPVDLVEIVTSAKDGTELISLVPLK